MKVSLVFARDRRLAAEYLNNPGREFLLQQRHETVPHTIPHEGEILVRFVVTKRNRVRRQPVADLRAVNLEQWPADEATLRADRSESPGPCAPDQLQEERFGLIVEGVAGGNHIGPGFHSRALEEGVSGPTAGVLERGAPRSREGPHVRSFDTECDPEASRDLATELFVIVRRRAQRVVEMSGRGDRHLEARRNLAE
jgi:hypothetical protein